MFIRISIIAALLITAALCFVPTADADLVLSKAEFTAADADHDGSLDLLESLRLAKTLFAAADANHNNRLEQAELPAWVEFNEVSGGKKPLPDIDANGYIDEQEFTAYVVSQLMKMDINSDGRISAAEYKHFNHRSDMAKKAMDDFRAADLNKDGRVDLREALELIRKNFKEIDTNKDGFITKDDIKSAKVGGDYYEDIDKDKKIDLLEFGARMLEVFYRADTNEDGVVMPHEYIAYVLDRMDKNYALSARKQ